TARMVMRVPPVMLPGLSAGMAEVAAMSDSAFCKSKSEDVKEEGPTAEDEDPAVEDEGLAAGVKGPGIDDESYGLNNESHGVDDESHSLDDESYGINDEGRGIESGGLGLGEEEAVPEGQQRAVLVVGTAVSEPLGLGYEALRHRELVLEEDHVYRAVRDEQERIAMTFEALWRAMLALEAWAGRVDTRMTDISREGFPPYPFNYPVRRFTIKEILDKFIDEGKRKHEEMEIFIKEFRTTNELLLKERSNLLSELKIESLLTNKSIHEEAYTKTMNERCSTVLVNELPSKEKDPRSFTILCQVLKKHKEAEDLDANHLSRFENPHMEVLTERRCVAGSETFEILVHYHSGPTGGHYCVNVTAKKDGIQNTDTVYTFQTSLWESMHLPVEIEHKAHWALKPCNMYLTLASKSCLMQLNELAELRDGAYENTRFYKERTKKWHDSRLRGDKYFKVYPYAVVDIIDKNGCNFKVNGQRLKKYYKGDNDKEDDDVIEFENGVT
nr:hypothetical protein [Tanacetum cinerariifolium]